MAKDKMTVALYKEALTEAWIDITDVTLLDDLKALYDENIEPTMEGNSTTANTSKEYTLWIWVTEIEIDMKDGEICNSVNPSVILVDTVVENGVIRVCNMSKNIIKFKKGEAIAKIK